MVHDYNVVVLASELFKHLASIVGRSVVDEDDLVVGADFLELLDEPLIEDRYRGSVPVASYDGGQLHESGTAGRRERNDVLLSASHTNRTSCSSLMPTRSCM